MSQIDNLITEYAEVLQKIYNEKTAGDFTFKGVLSEFVRVADILLSQGESYSVESEHDPLAKTCHDYPAVDWPGSCKNGCEICRSGQRARKHNLAAIREGLATITGTSVDGEWQRRSYTDGDRGNRAGNNRES